MWFWVKSRHRASAGWGGKNSERIEEVPNILPLLCCKREPIPKALIHLSSMKGFRPHPYLGVGDP